MTMEITIEVPEDLGEQVLRLRERLPEILEYGLRQVVAEMPGSVSMTDRDASESTELITYLRQCARERDYRTFADRVKMTNWATRQPKELTAVLDLALSMDMSKLARDLAQLGARLFPNEARLQQAARVLAPPVVSVSSPRAKGLAASRVWFREHAHQYKGQWVAVREGQLLGAAASLDELESLVPDIFDKEADVLNTVVTRTI